MQPGFAQIDTPSNRIDAMIVIIIAVIVTVALQCLNSWHTALDSGLSRALMSCSCGDTPCFKAAWWFQPSEKNSQLG